MSGILKLYTDAAIIGERLPVLKGRRRVGMTFVAWIGWHADHPDLPTLAGQSYIGYHGTQQAEFHALLHGLNAVLIYLGSDAPERRPSKLAVH